MSSFKSGVLPCPFGECGGVCEGLVVEEDDGEDGGEGRGEDNGGIKGGFSPFPPFLLEVFLNFLQFPFEHSSFHFETLNFSPCK